jgi:aminopeptidase N
VAGDVPVHVSTARGSTLDGAQVAQVAAAALTTYETRFGAYPYRELDIHLLPGQYDGGWEYPGLILLSSDAQVDAGTRYVAAHEVAHQWWYGVVGNDIYREPWLDEAFAQYSAIIYAEDMVGAAAAQADWEREVLQRYRGALADGDYPVGLAITDYPNFNVYYRTVYGKGAVFLRTLRDELGDDLFFQALQHYYARHRYGTGTTASLQQSFEEVSGRSLEPLFRQWVTGG